jgi:hypothetical protein
VSERLPRPCRTPASRVGPRVVDGVAREEEIPEYERRISGEYWARVLPVSLNNTGSFDVTIDAGLPPLPTGVSSTSTATVSVIDLLTTACETTENVGENPSPLAR